MFHRFTGLSDGNTFHPQTTHEKVRSASSTSPLMVLRSLMRHGPTKTHCKVANLTRLKTMLLLLG